jgi:hypothetical protein
MSSISSHSLKTVEDFVQRYPRILARIAKAAHLSSTGQAAVILRDAVERRKNYSEWVLTEHSGDAMNAVRIAIKTGGQSFARQRPGSRSTIA